METITPLSSGRGLPDLSVVEFANQLIALMRLGAAACASPCLAATLSDWVRLCCFA